MKSKTQEQALNMVEEAFDSLDLSKAQSIVEGVLIDEKSCRTMVTALLAMDYAHTASHGKGTHFMDCATELANQYYAKLYPTRTP